MRIKLEKISYKKLFKTISFNLLKKIFFLLSLSYFCIYSFRNFDRTLFNVDFSRDNKYIFLSFIFCLISIFFNALAWKNIAIWFGNKETKNNYISFYVITNILKYVPGGIWHFLERFNFLKDISNTQLAFYSTLIEPYFMLCAALFLTSIGIIFSPIYIFLILPLIFLNKKLIYFILKRLEILKSKTIGVLKIKNSDFKFDEKINLISFFPSSAFFFEILFVIAKFIGFIICLNIFNLEYQPGIIFLITIFCLSWAIGFVVPTAPGGVGIFEACFIFFVGDNIPQNILIVVLIYYRLIATSADLFLGLPFLAKKIIDRI